MLPRKARVSFYVISFSILLILTGCAGTVKNMSAVPVGEPPPSPTDGKSIVVFLRPSSLGFAIQSSVFEVKEDAVSLAGIVAAKKKVAYQVEPGEHLFMVIGESADFLSAEIEPNRTYYAIVSPRMGVWKARFSFKPISSAELSSTQFYEWIDACEWVKTNPASEKWASDNMNSIQSKHKKYYEKWMRKDPDDRPKLLPQDGK